MTSTNGGRRQELLAARLRTEADLQIAVNGPLAAAAIAVAVVAIIAAAEISVSDGLLLWVFIAAVVVACGGGMWWSLNASKRANAAAKAAQALYEFDRQQEISSGTVCSADSSGDAVKRSSAPAWIAAASLAVIACRRLTR